MRLYNTLRGPFVEVEGRFFFVDLTWDVLVAPPGLFSRLQGLVAGRVPLSTGGPPESDWLAPIGSQEVWAAGVTYFRSRDARMEESEAAGGGDFYARVYEADRPELFFKASPFRVRGPGQPLRIRRDARWSVPEPELALIISSAGTVEGFTIGNDMSSRDIEGENPLYLPQAKVYDGSCGLGPCVLVSDGGIFEPDISIEIRRGNGTVFEGSTSLSRLKRRPEELVAWLFREASFPVGAVLLTGTGIVPPNDFTLEPGDEVRIVIDGIGSLQNPIERTGGA
jgi:2-dehydro-3-deoxy-D-arabinonate dehydratase